MDAQLKSKWIEALRSGNYRQADGVLRGSWGGGKFEYCCLGVLCVVAGAAWKNGAPELDEVIWQNTDEELLNNDARALVGLSEETEGTLASMNDSGTTFPEIADYIEKNL